MSLTFYLIIDGVNEDLINALEKVIFYKIAQKIYKEKIQELYFRMKMEIIC